MIVNPIVRVCGWTTSLRTIAATVFLSGVLTSVGAVLVHPLGVCFLATYFWIAWRWKGISGEQLIVLGAVLAISHVAWILAMHSIESQVEPDPQGSAFLAVYLFGAFVVSEVIAVLASLWLGARLDFCEVLDRVADGCDKRK